MLPFTKRPGRSEDADVVTKDDLEQPTSGTKRSQPPPSLRARQPSFSDEELTNLIPSKSLGLTGPLPAAGRPAAAPLSSPSSRPSSRPASVPVPRSSARAVKFAENEDEEDGRTVVRGAPRIVKRSKAPPSSSPMGMPTSPTTISPAAVIKQTLASANELREARQASGVMSGPSRQLQMHPSDEPQNTVLLDAMRATGPQPMPQPGTAAMAMQPMPQPLPSVNMTGPHQIVQGYPPNAPMGYGPYSQPVPSASVPGVAIPSSMPAHFMVAQAPYSDARMDPPGTSVTSRTKLSAGRPAVSWAAALLAFGLFVGVGAVAVMQGNAENVAETTSQFVDPARAGKAPGGPAARPAPAGERVAVPTVGVPVVADPNGQPAAQPPVTTPVATAQPGSGVPQPGAVVVQTGTGAAQPGVMQPGAPAQPGTVVAVAQPAAKPHPHRPSTRPAAEPGADPPVTASAPAKPVKPAKPVAGGKEDDEVAKSKALLEKMQEEQLGGAKF